MDNNSLKYKFLEIACVIIIALVVITMLYFMFTRDDIRNDDSNIKLYLKVIEIDNDLIDAYNENEENLFETTSDSDPITFYNWGMFDDIIKSQKKKNSLYDKAIKLSLSFDENSQDYNSDHIREQVYNFKKLATEYQEKETIIDNYKKDFTPIAESVISEYDKIFVNRESIDLEDELIILYEINNKIIENDNSMMSIFSYNEVFKNNVENQYAYCIDRMLEELGKFRQNGMYVNNITLDDDPIGMNNKINKVWGDYNFYNIDEYYINIRNSLIAQYAMELKSIHDN